MPAVPGPIRSLRARSLDLLGGSALLLAFVALAATGLESVSFGHQHLEHGRAHHHYHFYFGPHEHSGTEPDHGHSHDHGKTPHPQDAPRRTATVAGAPVLAQPVGVRVLVVPSTEHAPSAPALAPAPPLRPAARLFPPRAPPFLSPS